MKQFLLLFITTLPLIAQQLKPSNAELEKPTITKIAFSSEWMFSISNNPRTLTPMSADAIAKNFNNSIPTTHSVFNITHLAPKLLPASTIPSPHWIAYDFTKQELVLFTSPSLATFLRAIIKQRFHLHTPRQIAVQAHLTSVKNPDKIITQWTPEIIKTLDPKPIANFSIISRSGQNASAISPAAKHQKNKLTLEPSLADDGRTIDLRLNFEIYPTDTFEGLLLNTSIILESQKTLIHPIGISTKANRLTVLTLKTSIVDATANPIPINP